MIVDMIKNTEKDNDEIESNSSPKDSSSIM